MTPAAGGRPRGVIFIFDYLVGMITAHTLREAFLINLMHRLSAPAQLAFVLTAENVFDVDFTFMQILHFQPPAAGYSPRKVLQYLIFECVGGSHAESVKIRHVMKCIDVDRSDGGLSGLPWLLMRSLPRRLVFPPNIKDLLVTTTAGFHKERISTMIASPVLDHHAAGSAAPSTAMPE